MRNIRKSYSEKFISMLVVFCLIIAGSAVVTADLLQAFGLLDDEQEFVDIPHVEDTESDFSYNEKITISTEAKGESIVIPDFYNPRTSSVEIDLEDEPMVESELESQMITKTRGKPEDDGEKGNKLGNAPNALYRVLQKFLAKGKAVPPNFPVPYKIYTNSSGVEKFTDCLTKMPMQINVDNNKSTGKGNGKDIRVKTTISTNPWSLRNSAL